MRGVTTVNVEGWFTSIKNRLAYVGMNFEAILYPLSKRSYLDFSVQIEAVITILIMNLKVLGGLNSWHAIIRVGVIENRRFPLNIFTLIEQNLMLVLCSPS